MNILKMAQSYLYPNQPSYMILFVTSRCNANCSFCFYGSEVNCSARKKDELTIDEYEALSKKCGNVPYLLVSGGEPVLRDDLFDIICFFIENANTQFVTVPSNGLSGSRSVDLFRKLTRKYPKCHFRAAFSIDFDNTEHDLSRGVEGCLEKVVQTASQVSELKSSASNLTVDVVSVYLNSTMQDHESMRKWVRERIAPDNHELHMLRPEWPEVTRPDIDTRAFLKQVSKYRMASVQKENRTFSPFFRGLNNMYIKGLEKVMAGKHLAACTAGRKFTVISETGKVRLCECREDVLGDLRENGFNLRKILRNSRNFLKYINHDKCSCTWECAVSCNIVCNPKFLPGLLVETARHFTAGRRRA